jgi:hypothetical protein
MPDGEHPTGIRLQPGSVRSKLKWRRRSWVVMAGMRVSEQLRSTDRTRVPGRQCKQTPTLSSGRPNQASKPVVASGWPHEHD